MPTVQKKVSLHYSAEQMFDLVNDVPSYPQFLPWCSDAQIVEHFDTGLQAKIGIDFKGIRQHFATRNTQQRPDYIDMQLVQGPFKALSGGWRFIEQGPHACTICFELHYAFSNPLFGALMGPVFRYIMDTFVDAFIGQAQQRYGHISISC